MNPGRMLGKVVVVALAIVALAGAKVTWAQDDSLGPALAFSLTSFAAGGIDLSAGNASRTSSPLCFVSGDLGAGALITLGNNGVYSGDAITYEGSIILDNYTEVAGTCATVDGGAVIKKVGATCGSTDTTGNSSLLNLWTGAYNSASYFACDVYVGNQTSIIPAVNIADGKSFTISDTVTGGLNFIEVPSLTIGNSATLTLSGGSTDTLVLRVDGSTSIGHGAKIVLAGGLTPYSVVIAAQGGISFWGNSTTINGTILSGFPDEPGNTACAAGSGTTINGALLCSGALSLGANARVNYQPAALVQVPAVCGGDS